ncbi:EXO1, partial [Cervus elaphus hippelaphus]
PTQSRSHSWTDKACQKSSNINSIWHRNYCPRRELDIVSDTTKVKENPSTVGIKQKIKRNSCEGDKSLNSPELFMPDLLEGTTVKKTLSTPPTTRNKFATFLQKKNEESGAVVVPGTRSRPEAGSCRKRSRRADVAEELTSLLLGGVSGHPAQIEKSGPRCCAASLLLAFGAAGWRAAAQAIGTSLDSADCISKKASSQLLAETAVTDKETNGGEPDCLEDKKLVDTSVSHNSSEQIPDDVTVMAEESQSFKTSTFTRTISPPTLGTLRSCFSWSGSLGDFSRTPSPSPSTALQQFRRKIVLKQAFNLQIPGLYKSSSVDNLSTTKIKPLVPARASGLSKKPSSICKRNHHNAENKPGLQIKINELWKNFVFKKDSEKLPSCKKPDPLSPVKDNIQLTPEEEDIFNSSE